jgi:hypothetical protein
VRPLGNDLASLATPSQKNVGKSRDRGGTQKLSLL